jgi:hypothetical protein
MVRSFIIVVAVIASLGAVSGAAAQGVCQGATPAVGVVVHGPVLNIPNASTICLATGASPEAWTAVAVPQLKASRAVLMAAAFGQNVTCVIGADGAGDCKIDGRALADEVMRPEIQKASMQWRDRRDAPNARVMLASTAR